MFEKLLKRFEYIPESTLETYNKLLLKLEVELADLKSKLKEHYPRNRSNLKRYSGKEIHFTGVYIMSDGRGSLVRFIDDDNKKICDHLWLKDVTGQGFTKGDLVKIKGKVEKYGSMSYKKDLTENYGIFDAVILKG